ncbi:hypothetical protein [Leminorella grimontii]|uniref:hypothetical protein n=1 Tax=Leminorella grimontii TaxID=82981 RepID=UPI00322068E5
MRKIVTIALLAFVTFGCSAMEIRDRAQRPDSQQQKQQKAERVKIFKGYGLEFRLVSEDEAYINGKRAQIAEREPTATVYTEAQYSVIYYRKGKAALSAFNRFIGYLKQ